MSPPITTNFEFKGGQIADHVNSWRKIPSDPWLLDSVRGVKIPFVELPAQTREPQPFRLAQSEIQILSQEVEKLLEKGIVEEASQVGGQAISNIFLRPKKDGGHRLILDLTWVNRHVEYEHFKMTSIQTALNMMRPECWMGSIDLKDAYYSVPVAEEHRKYLRFRWFGKLFQFRVLPNGLACAPRFFTKMLAPAYAILREQGIECFPYIDDSFVVADTAGKCRAGVEELGRLLEELGFVVHPTKSVFTPTQNLLFLGFELNSVEFSVFLTAEKRDKLVRAATDLLQKREPTIREVAGLVGLMVVYQQAFVYAGAYVKGIEKEKTEALSRTRGDFDQPMVLGEKARTDIAWWLQNIGCSGAPVRRKSPDMVVYTDASNEGWGAHIGELATGGRWSEAEMEDHINVLELKAILLGLQSLCPDLQEAHIRVMTDNTTALAYIKHMGGSRSDRCNKVAKEVWDWAEERRVWISIAHIPGIENVLADYKSRHFSDNLEWSLNDKLFAKVVKVFGEMEVDLFATRLNAKLPCYVSWQPDPKALAVDAFMLDWSELKFYAFPPFSLVGLVMEKILEDRATGVLIVPWWPTQPWWGRLASLGLRRLKFRPRKDNLLPSGKPDSLRFVGHSPLGAFRF